MRPSRARLSTPTALPRAHRPLARVVARAPAPVPARNAIRADLVRPRRKPAATPKPPTRRGGYGQARFRFYTDLSRRDSATTPANRPHAQGMGKVKHTYFTLLTKNRAQNRRDHGENIFTLLRKRRLPSFLAHVASITPILFVALVWASTLQTRSLSRFARLSSRVWSQFACTGEKGY